MLKQLIKIITDLIAREFYGKVIITFDKGKILPVIRKEETVKIGKDKNVRGATQRVG